MSDRVPIGVLGAGWVGLVTAACFADLGHEVIVRDVVPERIEDLDAGRVPIFEPGLGELVAKNRGRLRFTLDAGTVFESARIVFACVGTPPTYSGDADLSAVWHVLDEIPDLEEPTILVMKSTVPVGTGEKVRTELDARGLRRVGYVSNPEFLAEGTAVENFQHPDRVVVGAFVEEEGDAVAALYEPLGAPIVRTDVPSAEMIKYASNAFLATKISFINEIANVCEETGADVTVVAEGMGLDGRIGPRFLRAGIGYGGSCLLGEETVRARRNGTTSLVKLEDLFAHEGGENGDAVVVPDQLEAEAWRPGSGPQCLPVRAVTRRWIAGEILEITTKMGRRVRCTGDHPFVVRQGYRGPAEVRLARELTTADWLPVSQGSPDGPETTDAGYLLDGLQSVGVSAKDVIVRPATGVLETVGRDAVRVGLAGIEYPRGSAGRARDMVRAGALRLPQAGALRLPLDGAALGTARNGTDVPFSLTTDDRFWRIVGLYLAEGHCSTDGRRHRLKWSFHPTNEDDLVDEVAEYWRRQGVKADVRRTETAKSVTVSSRVLAGRWLGVLGAGRGSYDHRVPDPIWDAPESHKRALLQGLWLGDGSWSLVAGGPSVVLEYGTVSRDLADGMLRLLGELGIMARLKVGRARTSTCETFWLTISGAAQVEALLELIRPSDHARITASLACQSKRIAPTGFRRDDDGTVWVRVARIERKPYRGFVYSLEVPDANTFVTTGGLVVHNCFPKDIAALKQLAGNSGYHFQLLTSVIEVNELQKRRVVGKLTKHLGSLRGKTIALLGLAFKPDTNDMREAASLVLASRLLAEGARVRGWDPVAVEEARPLLPGVELYDELLDVLRGVDAAVIVTEWGEIADFPYTEAGRVMKTAVLVDGRNVLDPAEARSAWFVYESIGRPSVI